MTDRLDRLAKRIAGWDQEVVAYVLLTVAFAAALPYTLYTLFLMLFLDHPPGVLELAGGGQLWILNIGILAAVAVDVMRPSKRSVREPNAYLLILVAVLSLLMISVLPWGWVALKGLAAQPQFGVPEKVLALAGAPATLIAVFLGYVSIRLLDPQ